MFYELLVFMIKLKRAYHAYLALQRALYEAKIVHHCVIGTSHVHGEFLLTYQGYCRSLGKR